MSFSTSGLTALALASVVLIRSCSMTSLQRFLSSALRWALSRLSLPRLLAWRIAAVLVVAQAQPAGVQGLDHLVDRLAAEVRDRGQLALALGDQVADGLDARALEAVVGPHAELELLDEDVVHRAAGLGDRATAGAAADLGGTRPVALQRRGTADRRDLRVGEDLQVGDEDLGRLAQGVLRLDRAVGLDVERELVVVGALADTGGLHRVGDAPHRREDRVDGDDADRLIGSLVLLGRPVAAATADRHVHLELGLLLERGDVGVGVEDLHAGGQVDVLRGDLAGPRGHQRRFDLGRVRVHPADDALEVEDDVGDVLGHALDRRELVGDALDAHARHGSPGERGQQDAAQRVAERVAETAIERLDRGRAARTVIDGFAGNSGNLEVEHVERVLSWSFPGGLVRCPAGFEARIGNYLEYSSTMSCSWTGAAISRRSGLRSTLAVSASWSACSQAGTWAVSSVASRIAGSTGVPALTAMISPSRT